MNNQTQIGHLLTKLSAAQRKLDFGESSLWQQLPESDQRACCDAIAALLYQVASATLASDQHVNQENRKDGR